MKISIQNIYFQEMKFFGGKKFTNQWVHVLDDQANIQHIYILFGLCIRE